MATLRACAKFMRMALCVRAHGSTCARRATYANCRYIDFKRAVLKVDISTFSYSTTFTILVQYFFKAWGQLFSMGGLFLGLKKAVFLGVHP